MGACTHRYTGFCQYVIGKCVIIVKTLVRHGFRHLGEQVEGRVWTVAIHAFNSIQQIDTFVATFVQRLQDELATGLIAGQSFQRTVLNEVVGA